MNDTKDKLLAQEIAETNCPEHNFSTPVEMHYKDEAAIYPYSVIACSKCGKTISTKL